MKTAPPAFNRTTTRGVERGETKGTSRLATRGGRKSAPEARPLGRKPSKKRGADLHKGYRIRLQIAMVASLLLLIGMFRAPIGKGSDEASFTLVEQEVVQMEEIQQTRQIERPPPPPRPPVPVEVPNDRILDDVELDLDMSLDLDDMVDLPIPPAPPPPPEEEEESQEEEIFVIVEQMPEIVGGSSKVYEHLVYPDIARQAGVEGLSVIQLVVGTDGLPRDITVARSAGEVLDLAAIEAVSHLTFIPGRQRGRAVPVRMAIPIRFRLKDATRGG